MPSCDAGSLSPPSYSGWCLCLAWHGQAWTSAGETWHGIFFVRLGQGPRIINRFNRWIHSESFKLQAFVVWLLRGIFEQLICFDRSQGCCHEAFNFLIIAGFGFCLICFFLIIDLYISTWICIKSWLFQIKLILSTLIWSLHSERSRSSFAPLIYNLFHYFMKYFILP